MTTIKDILETVNLDELRKDFKGIGFTENQLKIIGLKTKLETMIEGVCDVKSYSNNNIKNLESYNSFEIINEELLNTLRQLYNNTKNNFVKNVIKSVGQNKKFTEKQLDIIVEEMIKFNLTINF